MPRPWPVRRHQHTPALLLPAADGVVYSGGSLYTTRYAFEVPSAWMGSDTYYFWRCFYLCDSTNATTAEQRAAASFTVVRAVWLPPCPPACPLARLPTWVARCSGV